MNRQSQLQLNDIIKHLEKWIDELSENNQNKDHQDESGKEIESTLIYQEFKKNLLQLYNQKNANEIKVSSLKKLKKELLVQTQIEKQLMEEYSNFRKLNYDIENEINGIKSEYLSNLKNEINNNNDSINNINNDINNNNNSTINNNINNKSSKQNKIINNNNNLNKNNSLLDNLLNISNNYNNNNNNNNYKYKDNLTESYNISFKKLKKYD